MSRGLGDEVGTVPYDATSADVCTWVGTPGGNVMIAPGLGFATFTYRAGSDVGA